MGFTFSLPKERYSDLGGVEELLADIRELIEWPLMHPEIYQHLGVAPPVGVLLHGPPGCGKTLLAQAIGGVFDLFIEFSLFSIKLKFSFEKRNWDFLFTKSPLLKLFQE